MYYLFSNRVLLIVILSSLFLGIKVIAAAESAEPKSKGPISTNFDKKIEQFDRVVESDNLEYIFQWLRPERKLLSKNPGYLCALIVRVAKLTEDVKASQILKSILEYSE